MDTVLLCNVDGGTRGYARFREQQGGPRLSYVSVHSRADLDCVAEFTNTAERIWTVSERRYADV